MKLLWRPRAWADYERWRTVDPEVWKTINALIMAKAISRRWQT